MKELIYAGEEVENLCRKEYPSAIIEDASDFIHEERFSFEAPELDELEFYRFATKNLFVLECLKFQVISMWPKDTATDDAKAIMSAVMDEVEHIQKESK